MIIAVAIITIYPLFAIPHTGIQFFEITSSLFYCNIVLPLLLS
jgi:hypothetical protein